MSRFLTEITLLMPTFSLPRAPPPVTLRLRCTRNAPLPTVLRRSPGFGTMLSPVTLSAPDHSTSELLRTLSMMAASGPTSWLSVQSDFL